MTDRTTEVFVISDLHVGGRYPAADAAPGERGFRMCTRVDALTRAAKDAGLTSCPLVAMWQ